MIKLIKEKKIQLCFLILLFFIIGYLQITRIDFLLITSFVVILSIEEFCNSLQRSTNINTKSNKTTFFTLEKFSFILMFIFIFFFILLRLIPFIALQLSINNTPNVPNDIVQIDYFPLFKVISLTLVLSIFPPIISLYNKTNKTDIYLIPNRKNLRISNLNSVLLRILTSICLMFLLTEKFGYYTIVLILCLTLSLFTLLKLFKN